MFQILSCGQKLALRASEVVGIASAKELSAAFVAELGTPTQITAAGTTWALIQVAAAARALDLCYNPRRN